MLPDRLARIAGSSNALLNSLLRPAAISAGVPIGTNAPYQISSTAPSKPASCNVVRQTYS